MTNLLTPFVEFASQQPDKSAIVDGKGNRISFGELNARSAAWAKYWQQKSQIQPGDRVLIAMAVSVDLYTAMAALWRIGAVIVFPEPALGLKGLQTAIEIAQPAAVLTNGPFSLLRWVSSPVRRIPKHLRLPKRLSGNNIDLLPATAADHPALISFTTGSTGRPKAIVRSHAFLLAQCHALDPLIGQGGAEEIDLVCFPVFVIANLALGISSVLPTWRLSRHNQADPRKIYDLVKAEQVTRFLVPPSICERLLLGESAANIKSIFTGGGPVYPDLLRRLRERFTDTDIVSVYGSTEAEPIAHLHMKEISQSHWDKMAKGEGLYAGHPVDDIKLKIIDDEICVTGDHVNKTYLDGIGDAENKTVIDGEIWHRTGDAGRVDSKGGLWLLGRLGGKAGDIYPFQVEVSARDWPGVNQAALFPGTVPPVLTLSGEEPKPDYWQNLGSEIGSVQIVKLDQIPMDRRHGSKVDYTKLGQLLRNHDIKIEN